MLPACGVLGLQSLLRFSERCGTAVGSAKNQRQSISGACALAQRRYIEICGRGSWHTKGILAQLGTQWHGLGNDWHALAHIGIDWQLTGTHGHTFAWIRRGWSSFIAHAAPPKKKMANKCQTWLGFFCKSLVPHLPLVLSSVFMFANDFFLPKHDCSVPFNRTKNNSGSNR